MSKNIETRKRPPLRSEHSFESCFNCFQRSQGCPGRSHNVSCRDCQRSRNPYADMKAAPLLHESALYPSLTRFGRSLSLVPLHFDESSPCPLRILLILKHRRKKKNTETVEGHIHLEGSFLPINERLKNDLDELVRKHLGLKLEFTDADSRLGRAAVLAGGYLSLIFPHVDKEEYEPEAEILPLTMDGTVSDASSSSRKSAEAHLLHFSLLRFGELVQQVMLAFRSLVSVNRDHALEAIAAAGILCCELKHISGNMRLLVNDQGLSSAIRIWLKELSQEILTRFQNICDRYPTWCAKIKTPRTHLKRAFGVQHSSLTVDAAYLSPYPNTPSPWVSTPSDSSATLIGSSANTTPDKSPSAATEAPFHPITISQGHLQVPETSHKRRGWTYVDEKHATSVYDTPTSDLGSNPWSQDNIAALDEQPAYCPAPNYPVYATLERLLVPQESLLAVDLGWENLLAAESAQHVANNGDIFRSPADESERPLSVYTPPHSTVAQQLSFNPPFQESVPLPCSEPDSTGAMATTTTALSYNWDMNCENQRRSQYPPSEYYNRRLFDT